MKIYKVVNKINGKCYIGQTIQSISERKTKHLYDSNNGSNFIFHKAIRKYGIEKFKWKVLNEFDSKEETDKMEQFYIELFDSFYGNEKGYNMTYGANGFTGRHHTEETKEILRQKCPHPQTEETKKKISKAFKGGNHPQYGKRKEETPMWNKNHTKKTKSKMSKKALGNQNGSKRWNLKINNSYIEVINLAKFCRDNGYNYQKVKRSCVI